MRLRKGISASVIVLARCGSIVQALIPPRGEQNKRTLAFRCQARGFEGSKHSSKRKLVIGSPGNRSGQGTVSPATITLPVLRNRAVSFNNHPHRSMTVNFQFLFFHGFCGGKEKKKKSPNKCQLIKFSGFALILWMGWN